jgi:CRISPR-associated protein Cas1
LTWGALPPSLGELAQVEDRIGFVYLERALVGRDQSAITATDDKGTVSIPAATMNVLMLGPGTSISHQAVTVLAECGVTCVWVGDQGVRYYAHGRGLSRSSRLVESQARLVSNERTRLAVARAMFRLRYPDEDVTGCDMQRLRGMEGARMRKAYLAESKRTSVPWEGRSFDQGIGVDAVNQALSAAAACLYGLAHSVIAALGCSPDLGFVHSGNDRSFVYDIADLYRAEVALPAAFDVAAEGDHDVAGRTRRLMRDRMYAARLVRRGVADVIGLLTEDPSSQLKVDFQVVGATPSKPPF